MGESKEVLPSLALMGEVILDQCRLKFKANQDAGAITEVAVLKVKETNEILALCRAIWVIPENRVKLN